MHAQASLFSRPLPAREVRQKGVPIRTPFSLRHGDALASQRRRADHNTAGEEALPPAGGSLVDRLRRAQSAPHPRLSVPHHVGRGGGGGGGGDGDGGFPRDNHVSDLTVPLLAVEGSGPRLLSSPPDDHDDGEIMAHHHQNRQSSSSPFLGSVESQQRGQGQPLLMDERGYDEEEGRRMWGGSGDAAAAGSVVECANPEARPSVAAATTTTTTTTSGFGVGGVVGAPPRPPPPRGAGVAATTKKPPPHR